MTATRLIPLHVNKGRSVAACLSARTDYETNPEKAEKGDLVTSYECDPVTLDEEFLLTKRKYQQITGRAHIHNHIIFNSTALDGTRKFKDFHLSGLALQRLNDIICLEHDLSVIEPKPAGSGRNERSVRRRKHSGSRSAGISTRSFRGLRHRSTMRNS